MNCFEARQEFAPFWRRRITPERRQALLAHLKDCAGCDRAFRAFALTAPVLHSEPAPREAASAPSAIAGAGTLRRFAPAAARRGSLGAWSTAAAMIVAASLAAYLSAAAPRQTLQDALVPPAPSAAGSELIGALAPTSPNVSTNDFAG